MDTLCDLHLAAAWSLCAVSQILESERLAEHEGEVFTQRLGCTLLLLLTDMAPSAVA